MPPDSDCYHVDSLGGRHHLVHQPLCQATGLAHVVDIAKVVQ